MSKKYSLLVVAHPDDETIFFGGLLQVYRRRPWKVVCVTDANADGQGRKRIQDFTEACRRLKVKYCESWGFPDRFQARLDLDLLLSRLASETPAEVFTHGPLGEYGHPHHQDVSLVVHRQFADQVPVWSPAYNTYAEKTFKLSRKVFDRKAEILSQIYWSETHRFARWLPASRLEGFARVPTMEVEALYKYLAAENGSSIDSSSLKSYAWFAPYLDEFRLQVRERAF